MLKRRAAIAAAVCALLWWSWTAAPGCAQATAAPDQAAADRFDLPESDVGIPGVGPIRREEWFRDAWAKRRAAFAERAEAEHGAVVFLGDSITQGWGDEFRGAFPEVKTANRGISGDTSRGLLMRLREDVLSLDPAAVVLLIGTNDIELGVAPADIAANVRLLLDQIAAHSQEVPVILCQVMPTSATKDRPTEKIRALNRELTAAVRGDRQVTVLDLYTLYADAQGDAKPEEFPDLLHPNDAGYAKWRAALWPLLATLGFVDREPDDFTPEEGFELLFNGRDLTGWGYRPNPAEDLALVESRRNDPDFPAWPIIAERVDFDGQPASPDGRYAAINGRLVVTTPSEGRKIQQLWTTADFPQEFTLRLQFRATPNTDSGVFVRGKQVQCRDYALAGPYKDLSSYKPQEWNDLEIAIADRRARCTVNGEVIEAAFEVPETGPIGLEGDRGQMEYRRIRVRRGGLPGP